MTKIQKIGFIGQGWIGKNYADDFENRGYAVVRYSLEEPYIKNKEKISECTIVFIAVPTPTTETGFSYAHIEDALTLLSAGTTAVIKSTVLPGTTTALQKQFPTLFVCHSPEFLREVSAAEDAANPDRNIIGITTQTKDMQSRAEEVLTVLPVASYAKIMPVLEAEMIKYIGNCFLYSKVLMMNAFFDTVTAAGGEWETVREAIAKDPRIGSSHTNPVHDDGRGAGGHCFIKDFEAFRQFHNDRVSSESANAMLRAMVAYNNDLLVRSGKNVDLLTGVYGEELLKKLSKKG